MKRYVTELISTYKGEKCHYRSKSYIGHKNYHLKIGKWAFLVAQMVKNPPAVWETWVPSLGWEDPLEECMTTHSSILVWRIPMDTGGWWATVHGVAESRT